MYIFKFKFQKKDAPPAHPALLFITYIYLFLCKITLKARF